MDDKDKILNADNNSLESPDTAVTSGVVQAPEANKATVIKPQPDINDPKTNPFKQFLEKVNIYFILLIILVILLGVGAYLAYRKNVQSAKEANLKTQTLTADALNKLSGTDTTVGDAKQTLTVESNAIFSGGILVRGNLEVAGALKSGVALSLPGLNVGGTTTLDQAALKTLTVSGDSTIQGKLTLQNNLSVNGSGSFNGPVSAPQITVDILQLSKDLQISKHIVANGNTPGRSSGSALGGGGTATVNGSDTAGTVVINTGNSAPSGCFITINFNQAYANTPKVIISPSSSSAASIDYYTNRSGNNFSICTASDPPDNTSNMVFDYIVIG